MSRYNIMTKGGTILLLRVGQLPKQILVREKVTKKASHAKETYGIYTCIQKILAGSDAENNILAQKNHLPHLKSINTSLFLSSTSSYVNFACSCYAK